MAMSMKDAGHSIQDVIEAYITKLETMHSGYFQSSPPSKQLSADDDDDDEDSDYESEHPSSDDEVCEYVSHDNDNNQSVSKSSPWESEQTDHHSILREPCQPSELSWESSKFTEEEWEIECTSKVLKVLKSKRTPEFLRRAICRAITNIATDRQWIRVKTNDSNHQLFKKEIHVSGKVTILWERAIQFSSKLTGDNTENPIYADFIRVWDIVMDQKMCSGRIKAIKKSLERGKRTISKHLKPCNVVSKHNSRRTFTLTPVHSNNVSEKSVNLTTPIEPNHYKALTLHAVPPNIECLVSTSQKFDLPIKIWPEEHHIVNMQSKDPIIVLGRSGTGKTTCCLYRMVEEFLKYYQNQMSFCEEAVPCLRQLFVTKNKHLCDILRKQFFKLIASHQLEITHGSGLDEEYLDSLECPLFVTSDEFLSLMENSLSGERVVDLKDGCDDDNSFFSLRASSSYQSSEISVSQFINVIWKELGKKNPAKCLLDPQLVWMEIISFIKGSSEAFHSSSGELSLDEYIELSERIAPNFQRCLRYEVYKIYEEYKQYCDRSKRLHLLKLYDWCDLVLYLQQKLMRHKDVKWFFNSLYIDEVQDFTQSEVQLLFLCLQCPHNIFLTGDTAQTVMRDVSFRFKDLKTSFFKYCTPNQSAPPILELTVNYRSHSGILSLARHLLSILEKHFPDSIDRVPSDSAMFPGPKPRFIQRCHKDTLMQLLAANVRNPSDIQFGHHQAIIVRTEDNKSNLPIENALTFTVYESKGLEFDDVLLYDFFSSCEVCNENLW